MKIITSSAMWKTVVCLSKLFGEGNVFCYLADLVILTNYIRTF